MTNQLSLNPVYLSARAAIVAPERAIPASIYTIQKWLPRLGAERWSLVMLLRSLCVDTPRRANGTKQVVCNLQDIAAALDIHKRTLLRWFKHEPIPNDSPWRRLTHHDEKAAYLALFIPRLRYAYESKNGKGTRIGLVVEILMEDPVVPEDEAKLQQHVELLQMHQGQMPFDTYRWPEQPNEVASADVKWHNDTSPSTLKGHSVTSDSVVNDPFGTSDPHLNRQNDTLQPVNRQNVTSENTVNGQFGTSEMPHSSRDIQQPSVNGHSVTSDKAVKGQFVNSDHSVNRQPVTSELPVNRQFVNSDYPVKGQPVSLPPNLNRQNDISEVTTTGQNGISEPVERQIVGSQTQISDSVNVNQLTLLLTYINKLKQIDVNNVNTSHLDPIVQLTEILLEDTHSTGMLYKTLKALYPTHLDLFGEAVQTALEAATLKPKINKGAVFVSALRQAAHVANVDSGLKPLSHAKTAPAPNPQLVMPLPYEAPPPSREQMIWQETKDSLRHQLALATYNSVIEHTHLLSEHGRTYRVGVTSVLALDWLENRLTTMVQRTLSGVVGNPVTITFELLNGTD